MSAPNGFAHFDPWWAGLRRSFNPINDLSSELAFYHDLQTPDAAYETLPGNTLATDQNDGIGAVLDLKRYKERGANVVTPDGSAWTASGSSPNQWTIGVDTASVDNTGGTASCYAKHIVDPLTEGKLYELTFTVLSSNGVGGVCATTSTDNVTPYVTGTGEYTFLIRAAGAFPTQFQFRANADWIGSIDLSTITVREVPGLHAYQDLAAAQPTLDIVGGARWAKFNGDDFLYIPNSAGSFKFLHDGTGGEMHIACRVSFGQVNYLFGNNGHAASAVGCTLRVVGGSSGSVSFMVSNGSGTPLAQEVSPAGVVIENEPLVLSLIHEPGTVRVLKNGEEVVSAATVGDPSTADALDDFAIGLPRRGSAGLPMLGACQSWVPVQGILSDYDRQRLISYMMRRAGI